MRGLLKTIVLIGVVLAIPVVPFLAVGPSLEARFESQVRGAASPAAVGFLTIGLLAADVFLPVPSSVVSAIAGSVLGFWVGTAACWLGMTSGAVVAFLFARHLGRPVALRLSSAEEFGRVDAAAGRYGPVVLVLARPVPLLAEASVLFFGAARLPFTRMLVPVALSNLGIAAVYAALGDAVQLPVAVGASIALPLLLAILARRFWPAAGKVEGGGEGWRENSEQATARSAE